MQLPFGPQGLRRFGERETIAWGVGCCGGCRCCGCCGRSICSRGVVVVVVGAHLAGVMLIDTQHRRQMGFEIGETRSTNAEKKDYACCRTVSGAFLREEEGTEERGEREKSTKKYKFLLHKKPLFCRQTSVSSVCVCVLLSPFVMIWGECFWPFEYTHTTSSSRAAC